MGRALEQAIELLEERRTQIENVRNYFIKKLKENFADIHFNGDYMGDYLFTVLNVSFKTETAVNMLLFKLDLKEISASGGSACNSGAVKSSRVLSKLNVPEGYHSVRFSFSHHNNIEEVDYTISKLLEII